MAFLNGLWVDKPSEKAPDFIKAKISINVAKMLDSLKDTKEEFINLDLKESKDGKYYAEIDEWKPNKDVKVGKPLNQQKGGSFATEDDSSLPF